MSASRCGRQVWPAIITGLLAILAVTPALAFVCVRAPLQPPEFQTGLTVFSVVPTTLSQGQTLVRRGSDMGYRAPVCAAPRYEAYLKHGNKDDSLKTQHSEAWASINGIF